MIACAMAIPLELPNVACAIAIMSCVTDSAASRFSSAAFFSHGIVRPTSARYLRSPSVRVFW